MDNGSLNDTVTNGATDVDSAGAGDIGGIDDPLGGASDAAGDLDDDLDDADDLDTLDSADALDDDASDDLEDDDLDADSAKAGA